MPANFNPQTRSMPRRKPPGLRRSRRGTTAIEGTVLLSTILLLLFVLFDFGLATFQYNLLSSTARYVARQATVHGSTAAVADGTWGPASYNGNAGDGTAIGNVVAARLATMPPSSVQINVTWPSGANTVNSMVQVTLSYTHVSLVPFLPGISTLGMQAQSTMYVIH